MRDLRVYGGLIASCVFALGAHHPGHAHPGHGIAAGGRTGGIHGGVNPVSGGTNRGGFGGIGGGFFWTGPAYFMTIGPNGQPVVIGPPWMNFAPGFVPTAFPMAFPGTGALGGPMPAMQAVPNAPARNAAARKADAVKGDQLVTVGDRLFRAGNLKRAVERYEQAVRLAPGSAAPLVRLAQVGLVRGQYAEAADAMRRAVAAEPGWLPRATSIKAIYGEPSEFNRPMARLESHLLADPGDRDGWLLLGAQFFLSGQTRRAGDVFLRLTDRRPDHALAAFLDVTGAKPAGP